MNVNLHIDSIVLDGIDLAPGDDRLIQQIVSRELTTLLSTEGLASSHHASRDSISGASIHLGSTGTGSLGHQLAHSIHGTIGEVRTDSTHSPKGTM